MLKITPTPWMIVNAPFPGIDSEGGQGKEVIIYGDHGEESGIRTLEDAEATVSAVNSTFGKGYDPVKMVSALETIQNASEDKGRKDCTWGDTEFDSESVAYGYNLALEHFKRLVNEYKL